LSSKGSLAVNVNDQIVYLCWIQKYLQFSSETGRLLCPCNSFRLERTGRMILNSKKFNRRGCIWTSKVENAGIMAKAICDITCESLRCAYARNRAMFKIRTCKVLGGRDGRGKATLKRQSSQTMDPRIYMHSDNSSGTSRWPLFGDDDRGRLAPSLTLFRESRKPSLEPSSRISSCKEVLRFD
jgi:hypothetical protein